MDSLLNSPSGWLEYAQRYRNVFGVAVTTGAVSDELWNLMAENLLSDRFRATKDYEGVATQSMIAWLLEASRRNFWNADERILSGLADRYIQLANQYGVVCCHHTCANMVFNQGLLSYPHLTGHHSRSSQQPWRLQPA